jgi:hypothetical protein
MSAAKPVAYHVDLEFAEGIKNWVLHVAIERKKALFQFATVVESSGEPSITEEAWEALLEATPGATVGLDMGEFGITVREDGGLEFVKRQSPWGGSWAAHVERAPARFLKALAEALDHARAQGFPGRPSP